MAKNEMKPGWEMTFMAEDIFKRAVSTKMAEVINNMSPENVIPAERYAEEAVRAAKIWRDIQKKHKFPDVITHGNVEDDE